MYLDFQTVRGGDFKDANLSEDEYIFLAVQSGDMTINGTDYKIECNPKENLSITCDYSDDIICTSMFALTSYLGGVIRKEQELYKLTPNMMLTDIQEWKDHLDRVDLESAMTDYGYVRAYQENGMVIDKDTWHELLRSYAAYKNMYESSKGAESC